MKKIKNKEGITLVSLVVTIVVMLILTISITTSMTSTIELKKYNAIKEDIIGLTEEIKLYYLKNEKLPVYDDQSLNELPIPTDALQKDVNPNDSGAYYYIDSTKLPNLNLNCGEGNKNKDYNTKDIYVVNEKSMTVYYLDGAVLNGNKHYTIIDDFVGGSFAKDYYSKVDLPIISVVTLEGNGKNKNLVSSGDVVTLKILSNYEFTTLPKVQINNSDVEVTWNGKIGTAKYTIPFETDTLNYDDKVTFSISGYEADNRTGEDITKTTFGEEVFRYAETLVQAFKAGNINVGDYIDYKNPTTGEYISSAQNTGLLAENGFSIDIEQKYTVDNNGTQVKWKVLGLNEDKTQLLITTEQGLLREDNANINDNKYYLYGAEGVINAKSELNKICSIYKNNYANEVRSITIDDINRLCGVKADIANSKVYKISDTMHTDIKQVGTIGTTYSYTDQYATPEDFLASPQIKSDFSKTSDDYSYSGSDAIDNTSSLYKLLFPTNNSDNYWLATTAFYVNESSYLLAPGYVYNDLVVSFGGVGGGYLFSSTGSEGRDIVNLVRPIAILKSEVTVKDMGLIK